MTDPWAPPDRRATSSWGVPAAGPADWEAPSTWRWLTTDVLVVGLSALLVLGGGSAVAVTRVADGSVDLAAAQADLERRLPELQAFVEEERGLEFREPVDATVLDDDAFVAALFDSGDEEGDAEGGEDEPDVGATLTALGLLDDDEDLDDVVDQALGEGVVGFYDVEADRLVVRGERIDPYVQMVLVHELVHALQDQVFDLDRPELEDADDERFTGFQAVVEGDATRVETAWRQSQSPQVQVEIDEEEARRAGSSDREPGVVDVLLAFPYFAGLGYVEQVLGEGGQERLDAALRTPPTTSEQVIEPLADDLEPVTVPDPDVEGEVVDEGVIGAAGLALLLRRDPTEPGPHLGWDGDRYATTKDGDRHCTTADVVLESGAARDALADGLEGWERSTGGSVSLTGEIGLRLRSCG